MNIVSRIGAGLVLWVAILLGVSGMTWAADLMVAAATPLAEAMTKVGEAYQKENSGVRVSVNAGGSGDLVRQIGQGTQFDVFATVDRKVMDDAAGKKLIDPATRRDFASDTLVLVVPAGSKLGVLAPADLANPGVQRIGIGNPEVAPAGRYAMEALRRLDLAEGLRAKLVGEEDVRQVLDMVVQGKVDAAFVFGSDAKLAGDKVKVVQVVAEHEPIVFAAAVTASSANKDEAGKFVAYLSSKPGSDVLGGMGFGPVQAAGSATAGQGEGTGMVFAPGQSRGPATGPSSPPSGGKTTQR